MATWGVLRLPEGADAAAGAGEGAVAASVAQQLDGLVAVAEGATVREIVALLPDDVTRIVDLDVATATELQGGELLARLLAADDGSHPAVVAARPQADALKRVHDGVVVEGLARDGLLVPQRPMVLDRATLTGLPDAQGDAASLLLAAGHAVRVVAHDGEALVVRSDGTVRGEAAR